MDMRAGRTVRHKYRLDERVLPSYIIAGLL